MCFLFHSQKKTICGSPMRTCLGTRFLAVCFVFFQGKRDLGKTSELVICYAMPIFGRYLQVPPHCVGASHHFAELYQFFLWHSLDGFFLGESPTIVNHKPVRFPIAYVYTCLVVSNPLKNMKVSWDSYSQ